MDVKVGGVALSTVAPDAIAQDFERLLNGVRRDASVAVPGRAGSYRLEEEPGDITIRIPITVPASSRVSREEQRDAIAAWAGVGPTTIERTDQPDRVWRGILVSANPVGVKGTTMRVEVVFTADPYSEAPSASGEDLALTGGPPQSGTFDAAVGTVDSTDPIIEITPTDGTITSFVLVINGDEIAWQDGSAGVPDTLAQDQSITISSISQTVTIAANNDMELTGVFDPDDVAMSAVAITGFPTILPGSNAWSLTWTGTATSVDVAILWRERYV